MIIYKNIFTSCIVGKLSISAGQLWKRKQPSPPPIIPPESMTYLPPKDCTSPPWVCSPELELELEPMILTSTFSKILIIYLKHLTYMTATYPMQPIEITNSTYCYVRSYNFMIFKNKDSLLKFLRKGGLWGI